MESRTDKIKKFNSILESFLSQTSPIVGSSYHFYFTKLILVNAPLPIKYSTRHMLDFKTQIMNKDENYFNNEQDDELNNKFNEVSKLSVYSTDKILGELLRLKDIYYKLDEESRENVWSILQALLQLTIEYKELSECK